MRGQVSAAHYVDSRPFGDATVTLINEGSFPYPVQHALDVPEEQWRPVIPEAAGGDVIGFDQHVVHVRLGAASILVDTGLGEPGQEANGDEEGAIRSPGVEAGLATIGVRPEDITHVLITHAHWDHIAGAAVERAGRHVARFPNARYVLGRADWENNAEPGSQLGAQLGTIERLGQLDLVEGDYEVVPGVLFMHTGGESPGHAVVRVVSDGAAFYALGDLFHFPCEVSHPSWASPWADKAELIPARERVLADAAQLRATLVFTHSRFPGWGRVVKDADEYRWVSEATGSKMH